MNLERRLQALESAVDRLPPGPIHDRDIAEAMAGLLEGKSVRPRFVDALYERIQPALHAAVIRASHDLRVCRDRNIDRPTPRGLVDLFATVISHDWDQEVAEDLLGRARVMTPRYPRYGDPPLEPTAVCDSPYEVREALMRLLYIQYGAFTLRNASITPPASLVPTLTDVDSARLVQLVQPLQEEPDHDLPLLLWKDPHGALNASWPRSGQKWTEVDIGGTRPGFLLLAHGGTD